MEPPLPPIGPFEDSQEPEPGPARGADPTLTVDDGRHGPPREVLGRKLGNFAVVEKIGAGGGGEVYRAEQLDLQRSAVIKVMRSHMRASEPYQQRFLREAWLASRLDHPYAAHIYGFGAEPDGLLWIAMEYVRSTHAPTSTPRVCSPIAA